MLRLASAAALLCAATVVGAQNVSVRIIGINDFHGHLEPGDNAIPVADPAKPSADVPLRSGGAAFLATRISQLRAEQPQHVVVSAGDLIGASPLTSGLFYDEPTIEVMNALGLELSALGNHEFDYGVRHLLRLANGGVNRNRLRTVVAARGSMESSQARVFHSFPPTSFIATASNRSWRRPGSRPSVRCALGSSAR